MDEPFERYRVRKLAIDQTGMGKEPVEDAMCRYGSSHVDGVPMTQAAKLNLATALRERFEDRTARIPAGDSVLRAGLHKVRKVAGPTGHPRLVADHGGQGHADRFWAACLGAAAASSAPWFATYDPITARRQLFDRAPDDDEAPAQWSAAKEF